MSALLKKELREHLLSRRSLYIFLIVSVLYSILAFSFISVKELSLLAQVEVTSTFIKVMLGISSLVLLVTGSMLISGEKEKGTLESLLLTPISKLKIMQAKVSGIAIQWLALLLLAVPYVAALTHGTTLFLPALLYLLIAGSVLALSFSCLAIMLSAAAGSTKNAMLVAIVLFFIAVLPMFLSTTTKKAGFAHAVNQGSPVSAALNVLKDALVNKSGIDVLVLDGLPLLVFLALTVIGIVLAGRKTNLLKGDGR